MAKVKSLRPDPFLKGITDHNRRIAPALKAFLRRSTAKAKPSPTTGPELIVLCCGDRAWKDRTSIRKALKRCIEQMDGRSGDILVVEGGANGADTLCREEAMKLGIQVCTFHANWKLHHKAAGPIRNANQLRWGKPTLCYAFHNFLPNSKGTKDMVQKCEAVGVPVRIRKKTGK